MMDRWRGFGWFGTRKALAGGSQEGQPSVGPMVAKRNRHCKVETWAGKFGKGFCRRNFWAYAACNALHGSCAVQNPSVDCRISIPPESARGDRCAMEFTVGSAIRFGWETFKKRPWFFVGATVVILFAYVVVGAISTGIDATWRLGGRPDQWSAASSISCSARSSAWASRRSISPRTTIPRPWTFHAVASPAVLEVSRRVDPGRARHRRRLRPADRAGDHRHSSSCSRPSSSSIGSSAPSRR